MLTRNRTPVLVRACLRQALQVALEVACLAGLLAIPGIPARGQSSYVVYFAASEAGLCPNTSGTWATYELAAEAEFAACQANDTFEPSDGYYFYVGECNPPGSPTSQLGVNCPVYFSGEPNVASATIGVYSKPESTGLFWVQVSNKQVTTTSPVAEPINPGVGNVYKTEVDGTFTGTSTVISFKRFYNSADLSGTDMGPSWRHSYDQSVAVLEYFPATLQYPGSSETVSPQYSSAATACTSGFAAIQSSVPAWADASTTYSDDVCIISNSGGQLGTLQIYSSYNTVAATAAFEYDLIRANGETYRLTVQNGSTVSPPGVNLRLSVSSTAITVTDDEDNVETYNTSGVLQSITTRAGIVQTMSYNSSGLLSGVTDSFGNSLTIARNSANEISSVSFSSGGTVQYAYDGSGRLSTVTNLDTTTLSYLYGDASFSNALTGENDETGTQLFTWGYDSEERGTSSELAGGVLDTTITYNSYSSATVTDALGAVRTFTYTRIGDFNEVSGISGSQCPTCQDMESTTYDAYGWVSSRTDYNGNLTCYQNDPVRGLELVRVEGFAPGSTCPSTLSGYTPVPGTLQRVITTQWSSSWREPQTITEATRTTSYTFDGNGNILTKTITDTTVTPNVSRTWTYSYNGFGQVLTAQDPLGNTTTYAYYSCSSGAQCGQVQTITNALSQTTTFNTYNAYGQPLTITDPNGTVTTLTYDARERLTSSQVGTDTTGYSYYATGLLKTVTLPDSSTITYTYDGAHRLTKITDGVGNYITYTLDALGNHTADSSYDPSGTLHRTHTRVFNTLSELYQDINAANNSNVTTTYGYDSQGNQTSIAAPLSRNTANAFDVLNRLSQVTDPNSGITQIAYDTSDNVALVSDPRSLVTNYAHDGFNELSQLVSPDTGATAYTYDNGGNLKTATDARGAVATYSYDALNRLTQMAYSDNTISLTYDQGTNGVGRLTGASDRYHSLGWSYDGLGRVIGKGQTVAGVTLSVGYAYTNGDMVTLVTPSHQTITYSYSNHQITSIAVNGATLLSSATYDPFGPVNGWTWGNNTTVSRAYDEDGNPNQFVTAGVTNGYTVDYASRITGISDSGLSSNTWTFGYDPLDRVTSGTSSALSRGYTFDANGNVQTETGTVAFTAAVSSTSNEISTITGGVARTYSYDAAGNITGDGTNSYTFNQRGRMISANGINYIYNAFGQLIAKSGSGATILMYDETGHIIGEYTSTGALIEETVWMGDTPVATLQPNGSGISVYYIHSDHLNTPRKITQPSTNTLVWRWDPDTFGSLQPNSNPSGNGTFSYNLRFPGQYYQSETGLNYNYFRDYDPQTGRYVGSDPAGLAAGLGTYSYGLLNPISFSDSLGLDVLVIGGGHIGGSYNIEGHIAAAVTGAGLYSYGNDTDIGSDVLAYLQAQSQIRNQVVTYIPTTPQQDAAIIGFYKQFPNRNSVGIVNNCAARTSEALHAGGIPVEGSLFPGDLSRQTALVPGAIQFFIPQNGPIPQALLNLLPAFVKH